MAEGKKEVKKDARKKRREESGRAVLPWG